MDIRGWVTRKLLDYLTQPLPHYQRFVWNDPQALRRHIRKGDVLLIDGDNRVSQIIKYLTQSCWSHAALYIGDELLRRGGEAADRAREAFGEGAEELLVEALPHGVIASPLAKYIDYNIRIARPHRLRPDHLKVIVEDALAAIGWRYDLRNVLDLARYLIPVHVVPNALRPPRSTSAAASRPKSSARACSAGCSRRCASRSCRRSSTPMLSRRATRAARPCCAGSSASRARATRASSGCATRRC